MGGCSSPSFSPAGGLARPRRSGPAGLNSAPSAAMCAASSELSVRSIRNELSEEYVTTSATTRPTAARLITPRISRARSDSRRTALPPFRFQHVPRLAHRPDQRRPRRVELASQVADVRLHDVHVAAEVVA